MQLFSKLTYAFFSAGLAFSNPVWAEEDTAPKPGSMPKAMMVFNAASGEVYHSSNPNEVLLTASLNKIMTAYLLFEHMKENEANPDSTITISENTIKHLEGWSLRRLNVEEGDTITYDTALKSLAVISAGDVSHAIAEHVSGSHDAFVELMNKTAKDWGMNNTIFIDATGFGDPNNGKRGRTHSTSTACDLSTMMLQIYNANPDLYTHYFGTTEFEYKGDTYGSSAKDPLFTETYEYAETQKTGYVRASRNNLISSAVKDETRLFGVSLRTPIRGYTKLRMAEEMDKAFDDALKETSTPVLEASYSVSYSNDVANQSNQNTTLMHICQV